MTLAQANEIAWILDDLGVECDVKEDYSGRGMYGATVPALIVDNEVMVGVACGILIERGKMQTSEIPVRRDGMGLSVVVY